jgi:ribosomal protein S18 acetylase RimI-like enzyme
MTSLDLRLAADDEHAAVDRLVRDAYTHDYGPRDHRADVPPDTDPQFASVRARRFDVWVAVDADRGELLGSSTTRRRGGQSLMEDAADRELDLRLLAVSPSARRQGIGRALVEHAIDRARESGYEALFLKSAPEMHGAHALYRSLGFARVPERDPLIIDGRAVRQLVAFRYGLG